MTASKREPLRFPTSYSDSTTIEVRWPPRIMNHVELWVGSSLALLNSEEARKLSKELTAYADAMECRKTRAGAAPEWERLAKESSGAEVEQYVIEVPIFLSAELDGPEVDEAKQLIHSILLDNPENGDIQIKDYVAHPTSVDGGAHVLFAPEDQEEAKSSPVYQVFIPLLNCITAAASVCRGSYFLKKHKPGDTT